VHRNFPKWRDYYEYAGGQVNDWGAQHMDIVQWALGKDASGPDAAKKPASEGDQKGAAVVYDDITITHGKGIGVHLIGSEDEIELARGGFSLKVDGKVVASRQGRDGDLGAELDKAEAAYLKNSKVKLTQSPGHVRNFLDCVKSRKEPIASAFVGARSINVCHLMNLAYRHHTDIMWNPVECTFAKGSDRPASWLTRDYRGPWKV
jgi:predicted dehydrogenase